MSSLAVTVDPPRLALGPGDGATVSVEVTNASDVVEHYAVRLLGLPPGQDVEVTPPTSKLHPGESGRITVRMGLSAQHPPQAAHLVLGVLVFSPYRAEVSRCEEVRLEVRPAPGLSVRAEPEVAHGSRGEYVVTVANEGNTALDVALDGTDPERRVRLGFRPARLQLAPGASGVASVTASAARPLTGQERRRSITVTARAGDRTGELRLTLVQRPRIAGGLVRVGAVVAGLAVTVATVLGAALLVRGAISGRPAQGQQVAATQPPSAGRSVPAPPSVQPPASVPVQPNGPASAQPRAATSSPPAGETGGTVAGQRISVDLTQPPPGVAGTSVIAPEAYPGVTLTAVRSASANATCAQETRVQYVAQRYVSPGFSTPLPDGRIRLVCMDMPVRIQFERPVTEVRVTLLAKADEKAQVSEIAYGITGGGAPLQTAVTAPDRTIELVWRAPSPDGVTSVQVGGAPAATQGGFGAYNGAMTAIRAISAS